MSRRPPVIELGPLLIQPGLDLTNEEGMHHTLTRMGERFIRRCFASPFSGIVVTWSKSLYSAAPYVVEVRPPSFHHGLYESDETCKWHRDELREEPAVWLLVWANTASTEVRTRWPFFRKTYDLKPGVVYLLDNKRVEHRTPLEALYTNRYFIRAFIKNDFKLKGE